MLSMYSRAIFSLAAMLLLTQAVSAEGDADRGKVLSDTCIGCHAVDTYNNVYPTYHVPKVAGQNSAYIASALALYRSGERKHQTMTAQAASLSDQDIEDIAAYMSAAGGSKETAVNGTSPDAVQVCAACHGANGISPIPTNPNLAGQHQDYIQEALAQYQRGDRKGPNAIAMQAQLMAVSAEDLAAIAAFFASQKGLEALPIRRW